MKMNGIHEVSGSIPLGSTNEIKDLEDFEISSWFLVAHWSRRNACRAMFRDGPDGPPRSDP
jgi:hypothetical protein